MVIYTIDSEIKENKIVGTVFSVASKIFLILIIEQPMMKLYHLEFNLLKYSL